MNKIKKYAGVIWMVMGPLAIYFLIRTAAAEIVKKPVIDTKIQWTVFVIIFIPIALGMMIFGWYALTNQYDHLPESSAEIND